MELSGASQGEQGGTVVVVGLFTSMSRQQPMTSPGIHGWPYGSQDTFHFLTRLPSYAYESGASPTPSTSVNGHASVAHLRRPTFMPPSQ